MPRTRAALRSAGGLVSDIVTFRRKKVACAPGLGVFSVRHSDSDVLPPGREASPVAPSGEPRTFRAQSSAWMWRALSAQRQTEPDLGSQPPSLRARRRESLGRGWEGCEDVSRRWEALDKPCMHLTSGCSELWVATLWRGFARQCPSSFPLSEASSNLDHVFLGP